MAVRSEFGIAQMPGGVLRIGITGASCTGKTTLTSSLAKNLEMAVAKECAREAASAVGIGDSNQVCAANAIEFQRLVFELKVRTEQELQPCYVSDRTVIDCAAFWLYREVKGVLGAPPSRRRNYFRAVEEYLEQKPYDVLFFIEHGAFPWRDDGFRIEDQEPMSALLLGVLGGRFRRVLESTQTRVVMIPREVVTIESRVAMCVENIRKLCRA
jgi:nicotinamide riboside kinase